MLDMSGTQSSTVAHEPGHAERAFQNVQSWLHNTRSSWGHHVPLSSCLPGVGDGWIFADGFAAHAVVPWLLSAEVAGLTAFQVASTLEPALRKVATRKQHITVHLVLIFDGRVSPQPPPGVFDFDGKTKPKTTYVCSAFDVAAGQFIFIGDKQKGGTDELLPVLNLPPGESPDPSKFAPAVNLAPTKPVATIGLLLFILAIGAAQFAFRVDSSAGLDISVEDLVSMGGNLPPKTSTGDYWRLATAALLHGSVLHLALNLFCIWVAGRSLERLIGRLWFLAAFAATALAGSAASMAFGADNVVSIGASGGALGLMGVGVVVAMRLKPWSGRNLLLLQFLQILIPSVFAIRAPDGSAIDVAAHVGGALAGALLGLFLRMPPVWPQNSTVPGARPLALAFTALFGALATWGAAAILPGWSAETARIQSVLELRERQQVWLDRLMPNERAPQPGQSWDAVAVEFPFDPRVRLITSEQHYMRGDIAQAIELLEPVWREIDVVAPIYVNASFGDSVAVNMALYYRAATRFDESNVAADVGCASTVEQVLTIATQNGLCDPRRRYWQSVLMPDTRQPQEGQSWDAVAAEFPNDPRVLLHTSEALYLQGDTANAIAQLEPVWRDREVILQLFPNPVFVDAIAVNMALYYTAAARRTEAAAAAAVGCATTAPALRAVADQNGICAPSP